MLTANEPRFLAVDDIAKRFHTPDGVLTAIDGMSLSVAAGEFVAVIGPSGCGKSTLFNIIGGLLGDYEGRVTVAGETIAGPHPAIGMVFQEESTFPWRTVVDNVAFPLEIAGMAKRERLERARHFIALVGLDGFERRYPAELSGGMRQRVALARSLITEPDVLLMDEPFAAVDAQTRIGLQELLLGIWERTRKTVLFVTHAVDEALLLADRVYVLSGRPAQVREVLEVGLPRPRDPEAILGLPEYRALHGRIWSLLRETA
jgi:NitT/TauT family transport system ATP-binding protein